MHLQTNNTYTTSYFFDACILVHSRAKGKKKKEKVITTVHIVNTKANL